LRLRPEEERLARIHTGYGPASTASRLDAFLLPDSLKFAEYNGESPRRGLFRSPRGDFPRTPHHGEISQRYDSTATRWVQNFLKPFWRVTRLGRFVDGTADRDCGLGGVPTWSEFEILQERSNEWRATLVADPRELELTENNWWRRTK